MLLRASRLPLLLCSTAAGDGGFSLWSNYTSVTDGGGGGAGTSLTFLPIPSLLPAEY